MKKLYSFLLVLCFIISVTGITMSNKGQIVSRVIAKEEKAKFVKDEIIICYNNSVNLEEGSKKIKEKYDVTQLDVGYNSNFEVVQIPSNKSLEDLMEKISKEKYVRYAEYNFLAYPDSVPNDAEFDPHQWNFYDRGTLSNGYVSDFGIQAVSAWTLSTGNNVKVAILDTGVAYANYSIYNRVKGKNVLVREYKQAPDLVNTKFDTANAWNWTWPKGVPRAHDDLGHGTHVAGTIAQSTNNTLGCAGIAYNSTILPIKVLNATTGGTHAMIANGIKYAADKGARVINMSLGGTSSSITMSDAINYAYNKGVVIVCSAGNDANNTLHYPAAYEKCIAVGATRFNGLRTSYSCYGDWVDIMAPGGQGGEDLNYDGNKDGIVQNAFWCINSDGSYTFNQNFDYMYFGGTSMAAPHVAGVAALILSAHPTYTVEQVRTAILSTALDLGVAGKDSDYGYGLVDAYAAVKWTPPTP